MNILYVDCILHCARVLIDNYPTKTSHHSSLSVHVLM